MNLVQVVFVLAIFVGLPALLFGLPPQLTRPLPGLVVAYLAIRFFVRLRQVDRSVVFGA